MASQEVGDLQKHPIGNVDEGVGRLKGRLSHDADDVDGFNETPSEVFRSSEEG